MLVRRQIAKIDRLAKTLMVRGSLVDDAEIREIAGVEPPPADGPIWLAFQVADAGESISITGQLV